MSSTTESGVNEAELKANSGYRWFVIGLVFVVYTAAYADRANVGIVLPSIRAEFSLSNTQAGLIASAFAIAYGAGQIPAAYLIRKLGVHFGLPIFLGLTSIVTVVIGASITLVQLVVARIALGLTEAPVAIGVLTTINNWFPAREKGTASGIFMAASKFAPVIVPPLGAFIIVSFGWRYVFYFCAVPGLLLALAWYLAVPDDPKKARLVSKQEADYIADGDNDAAAAQKPREDFTGPAMPTLDKLINVKATQPMTTTRDVYLSWNIWAAALGYFCMQGIVGVILAWLPTYLTEVKKYEIMSVGFVSSAPFVGAVLGNLVGGVISDRLLGGRRKPTMILSAAFTIIMTYTLTAAPNEAMLLALLLFLTGFLLSLGISAFLVYPTRLTTRQTYPFAVALLNTCGQMGLAFFPLITGVILDHFDWGAVFPFLSASSLVTLILMFTMIEPVRTPAPQSP